MKMEPNMQNQSPPAVNPRNPVNMADNRGKKLIHMFNTNKKDIAETLRQVLDGDR